MSDRPLFGAGSSVSKHTKNRAAFLRPSETSDGRLQNATASAPALPPITTPTNGLKSMRQAQSVETAPTPIAVSNPTVQPVANATVALQPISQAFEQQPAPQPPIPQNVQQVAVQQSIQPTPVIQTAQIAQAQQIMPAPVATIASPTHDIPQSVAVDVPPALQSAVLPVSPMPVPQAPTASQAECEEDRKEIRKRTLKGAMIILPGQMMSSYACRIRNESSGGAMLVLSEALRLPTEFYLVRDADPGNRIACRTAWKADGKLGVEFINALSVI